MRVFSSRGVIVNAALLLFGMIVLAGCKGHKDGGSGGSDPSKEASEGGDVTMTFEEFDEQFLHGGLEKVLATQKKYAGHYVTVKGKVVDKLPGQENTVVLGTSARNETSFPLASRPASMPQVGQQVTLRGKCDANVGVTNWELIP
jgi:hypothetical protein